MGDSPEIADQPPGHSRGYPDGSSEDTRGTTMAHSPQSGGSETSGDGESKLTGMQDQNTAPKKLVGNSSLQTENGSENSSDGGSTLSGTQDPNTAPKELLRHSSLQPDKEFETSQEGDISNIGEEYNNAVKDKPPSPNYLVDRTSLPRPDTNHETDEKAHILPPEGTVPQPCGVQTNTNCIRKYALIILAILTISAGLTVYFRFRECPKLANVKYSHVNCTRGVDSKCSFECENGHNIQGESTIMCKWGKWSGPEPTCVCPKCTVGEMCQFSTNWKDVAKTLAPIQVDQTILVHYGGRNISCTTDLHSAEGPRYSGTCEDAKASISQKCHNYLSRASAAQHAAAALIKLLEGLGKCPAPCDPEDMVSGCDVPEKSIKKKVRNVSSVFRQNC